MSVTTHYFRVRISVDFSEAAPNVCIDIECTMTRCLPYSYFYIFLAIILNNEHTTNTMHGTRTRCSSSTTHYFTEYELALSVFLRYFFHLLFHSHHPPGDDDDDDYYLLLFSDLWVVFVIVFPSLLFSHWQVHSKEATGDCVRVLWFFFSFKGW